MKKHVLFSTAEFLCLIIFFAGISLPFFKHVKADSEKKRQEVFLEQMMQHNIHYRVKDDFAYIQLFHLLCEKMHEKQNLRNLHFSKRHPSRFWIPQKTREQHGPHISPQNTGEFESDEYILWSHYDVLSYLKIHRKRKANIGTASLLVADYIP